MRETEVIEKGINTKRCQMCESDITKGCVFLCDNERERDKVMSVTKGHYIVED